MPPPEQQSSRRLIVHAIMQGGISRVLPYGSQSAQSAGDLPPFIDAQNVLYARGALRNAWHWTPLDGASHVNPAIDGNIASRQETASTNAQYPVAATLFSTSSSGQQAYVILTDGEVFVNGVSMNPVYGGSMLTTAAGIAFTNQPANDGVEVISDDAGDTTQTLTVIGTTTGTDTVVVETVTLNGTTQVATTKTDWGVILAVKLSASADGTVTVREASANATITTLATGTLTKGVETVTDTAAFNAKPSLVASGTSTKQIGLQGTDSAGATIYDSQALTGATAVVVNTAFRTVTEVYTGDLEATRTVTVYSGGTSTFDGTGTGTSWDAQGIKQADLFKLDSDSTWRVISAVGSDTSITTVTDPGSGSGTYQIRRTFMRTNLPGMASMAILNGDLYVACRGGGVDPAAVESDWCVLKVADIFGTPLEAEYVLAGWNITGSIPTKSILTGITRIVGIQASMNGQLVLLVDQDGSTSRVLWCSPRDTADWTGEEAGFTDLVPSLGDGRAFSRIGEVLCAYFVDSVHIGIPSGDTFIPYHWRKSRAGTGTRWYRAVTEFPGGNLYLGSDGNIRAFNGDVDERFTDDTIRKWTRGSDEEFNLSTSVSPASADLALSASIGSVSVT